MTSIAIGLAMGLTLAWAGAGGPDNCGTNGDCPPGWYCKKPVGDCDGVGECVETSKFCPAIYAPVCGCNGGTYVNACEAARAGVNVAFDGACEWACGGADLNHDGIVDGGDLAIVLGAWGPCP